MQAQETRDPELRKALLAAVSDTSSFPDRFEAEVWLTAQDLEKDLEKEFEEAVRAAEGQSADDLLKQVYYRATFDLCPPCQRLFLANPLQKPPDG